MALGRAFIVFPRLKGKKNGFKVLQVLVSGSVRRVLPALQTASHHVRVTGFIFTSVRQILLLSITIEEGE